MISFDLGSTGPPAATASTAGHGTASPSGLAIRTMPALRQKATTFVLLAAAAALLLPATASAQGNSGADQYREGVPGGGGDTPTGDVNKGDDSSSSVSDATEDALTSAGGSDGAQLTELTNATAPQRASHKRQKSGSGSRSGSGEGGGESVAVGGDAAEQSLRSSIGAGPSGLGWGLPALMGLGLVAALGLRVRNRALPPR